MLIAADRTRLCRGLLQQCAAVSAARSTKRRSEGALMAANSVLGCLLQNKEQEQFNPKQSYQRAPGLRLHVSRIPECVRKMSRAPGRADSCKSGRAQRWTIARRRRRSNGVRGEQSERKAAETRTSTPDRPRDPCVAIED